MLVAAGLLAGFAVVGTTLVAVTEDATRQRIADNELAYLLRTLNDVVPATAHDNRMYADTIEVTDPDLLGSDRPVTVYRATRDGQPVAVILTPVAPVGYSGPIRLLVGIDAEGVVTGVRVLDHQETPGLGDAIEKAKSDWILGFDGRSLGDPPLGAWAVRRDGGAFDQFTGATVTPRAVVKAVRNALLYFQAHRQELLSAPPGDRPGPGDVLPEPDAT
jgi:electron transport complex protein RnfG